MLPALLLGYFFTPAVVGYYALGHRVLAMPMGVVGGSIAQVFFPRANEAKRSGNLDQLTLEMFQRLLAVGFVPILLIAIVAPDLFAIIFGTQWLTAGEYVRWLSLWMLFQFISSPLSTNFIILERQDALLLFNIFLFLSRIIILIWAGSLQDDLLAIKLLGSTGGLIYLGLCIWVLIMSGLKSKQLIKQIFPSLICAIPYIIPVVIIALIGNPWFTVVISILSGLVFLFNLTRNLKTKDFDIRL